MSKVLIYVFIVKNNDLRGDYFIYIKNGKYFYFMF